MPIYEEPLAGYAEPKRNDPQFSLLSSLDREIGPARPVSAYVGVAVEADKKGKLTKVCSTDGKLSVGNLHLQSGICYVVTEVKELYWLLKVLVPPEVWTKQVLWPHSIFHGDFFYFYSRNKSISIWNTQKKTSPDAYSTTIQCIQAWLPPSYSWTEIASLWRLSSHKMDFAKGVALLVSRLVEDLTHIPMSRRISAPAALGREIISNTAVKYAMIPQEAQQLAYEAIHAPVEDVFIRGFVESGDDVDVNLAYSMIAAFLVPDFETALYKNSSSPDPEAVEGYAFCLYEIYPNTPTFCCVRARKEDRVQQNFLGYGKVLGYLTYREIKHLESSGHGKVLRYQYCQNILLNNRRLRPFKVFLGDLVNKRVSLREGGEGFLTQALKLISNTCYGLWLERYERPDGSWEAGPYFSPVHANWVLTSLKLELESKLMRNPGAGVLEIVDGMCIQPNALTLLRPEEIHETRAGHYKVTPKGPSPLHVIAPNLYSHNGRDMTVKMQVRDLLFESQKRDYLELPSSVRVRGPKEAAELLNPSLLGCEVPNKTIISLGNNYSKAWTENLTTGQDFLKKRSLGSLLPVELASFYQEEEDSSDAF